MGLGGINKLFQALLGGTSSVVDLPVQSTGPAAERRSTRESQPTAVSDQLEHDAPINSPDVDLRYAADSNGGGEGATVAQTPQAVAAKLRSDSDDEAVRLCRAFAGDRTSLDDNPDIEWVEGWHGVRENGAALAVPGILKDQGLFVGQSVSYMPCAAYWHATKPPDPRYWRNHAAEVHFRIPKIYLEQMGEFVQDRSAGCRFSHSGLDAPRSQANKYQEIMPIQILAVYWIRGSVPETCRDAVVDLTGAEAWPETPPRQAKP